MIWTMLATGDKTKPMCVTEAGVDVQDGNSEKIEAS
jgi:hypothetical protein